MVRAYFYLPQFNSQKLQHHQAGSRHERYEIKVLPKEVIEKRFLYQNIRDILFKYYMRAHVCNSRHSRIQN